MSSAILKYVGKVVVSQVWAAVQKKTFQPDNSVLEEITGGLNHLENVIRDIDYANQLREPSDTITRWTSRMEDIMKDITEQMDAGEEPDMRAYNELCDAMRSEATGNRLQTDSLYRTLMGPNLPIATSMPLINYWQEQEFKLLSQESNTSYFARDYISILDGRITAISALLSHGMDLSFYVAYNEKDAQRLRDTCEEQVTAFRDRLWELFPPGLRWCMQDDYDNDGSFIANGSYFDFFPSDDTTGKEWLSIGNYWIREILVASPGGDKSNVVRSFRFSAPDGPLGPLQLHAYWLAHGGHSLVKFYDDRPAGTGRTYAYTNSKSGKIYPILFKMIPTSESDANGDKRPLKFVPYREDTNQLTQKDRWNTWGYKWRLEQTDSPQ